MSWSCDEGAEWEGPDFIRMKYENVDGLLIRYEFNYPEEINSAKFEYILLSKEVDGNPMMAVAVDHENRGAMLMSQVWFSASELKAATYRVSLQYNGKRGGCGFTHTKLLGGS